MQKAFSVGPPHSLNRSLPVSVHSPWCSFHISHLFYLTWVPFFHLYWNILGGEGCILWITAFSTVRSQSLVEDTGSYTYFYCRSSFLYYKLGKRLPGNWKRLIGNTQIAGLLLPQQFICYNCICYSHECQHSRSNKPVLTDTAASHFHRVWWIEPNVSPDYWMCTTHHPFQLSEMPSYSIYSSQSCDKWELPNTGAHPPCSIVTTGFIVFSHSKPHPFWSKGSSSSSQSYPGHVDTNQGA